jgi:thymidylate kinase
MQEAINRWRERSIKSGRKYCFEKEDIIDLAQTRGKIQKDLLKKAKNKKYVLMDRGIYTSAVFESGRVSMEEVLNINSNSGVIFPQQCVVLDCPPTEALRRVDQRRAEVGKYSHRAPHENEEFISRARELYKKLVKSNDSMHLIDSFRDPKKIFLNILEVLNL